MSEKANKTISGAVANIGGGAGGGTGTATAVGGPNRMRIYATCVERTPSNCIPRLCTLSFIRLVILKPLGSDVSSISIAVKMQSSKRTLRSHELIVPQNGLLDTAFDVTFCLQYPHYLKREGNKLHIMLRRRKRYKNRTMLGFKTIAVGTIRMDQVLQKQMDMELELYPEGATKDKSNGPIARLTVIQLSSTPVVEHDQQKNELREHDYSEDDDLSSGEEEAGLDLSDSEPMRKLPHTRHNLKQRFVSLLRRFRAAADSEGGRGVCADLDNPSDIQALFQELESLSCDDDSGGGEQEDTMSISSTPKPSLRPFFSSSKSLLDNTNTFPYMESLGDDYGGSDGFTDGMADTEGHASSDNAQTQSGGSPPREQSAPTSRKQTGDNDFANIMQELSERKAKLFRSSASSAKKKNSLSVSDVPPVEAITARKVFLELISKLLPLEENILPECVVLMTATDNIATTLSNRLSAYKIFQPLSSVETKAVLTGLFNKIHKYCNNCAKPGNFIKILLIGGDTLLGWFVRPYVELLSSKPSDWLNFMRIYIVPMGSCNITRHMSTMDAGYAATFPHDQELPIDELAQRIQRYLNVPPSAPVAQLPLGEAMLTCIDESSQVFIPFVHEVRVGPADQSLSISVDMDDLMCSSPPAPPPSITPPSSPNVQARDSPWEPLELQLDYWQLPKFIDTTTTPQTKTDKPKLDGKVSMKALFKGLQASPTSSAGLSLTMHWANKEKKQKIMRLGKKKDKEKDTEPRSQNVEGVSRLICSARASNNTPMKVYIDGVEYGSVKFFQLSATWQTHVKNLTVSLIGVPLASVEN